MKNESNKKVSRKNQQRSGKAAAILRTLDDKQLSEVAGGGCRTCGTAVSLEAQVKAAE